MSKDTKKDSKNDIIEKELFRENEKDANHYTSICLIFSAAICVVVWMLNLLNFFVVDDALMNTAIPVCLLLFAVSLVLHKTGRIGAVTMRYILFISFLLIIAVLSVAMPRHLIMAWACPIVLAGHYYSPKFTRFALAATLIAMLFAVYGGMFFGEWDANMYGSADVVNGLDARLDYIELRKENGSDILLNAFEFYYVPRAAILSIIYIIIKTLSGRTRGLLLKQGEVVRESERITTELSVANHIQTSMLPNRFPAFPEYAEFDIFADMIPAKEVGGDFYDFFMVDERHLAIVIADVSGKGVPAALFMVIGKTLIKDHTKPDRGLEEVFEEVNELLCQSNSEGLFITAFEGVLDLDTGEFVFVNAGHEQPYICKKNGEFEPYKFRSGFVLAGMDGMKYRAGSMKLDSGDIIFQYTDGVTEATNAHNELYGMDRLGAALNKVKNGSPEDILSAVKADIDKFVGDAPQFDDITMLCLEYKHRSE